MEAKARIVEFYWNSMSGFATISLSGTAGLCIRLGLCGNVFGQSMETSTALEAVKGQLFNFLRSKRDNGIPVWGQRAEMAHFAHVGPNE